jgi:hypothetical protein
MQGNSDQTALLIPCTCPFPLSLTPVQPAPQPSAHTLPQSVQQQHSVLRAQGTQPPQQQPLETQGTHSLQDTPAAPAQHPGQQQQQQQQQNQQQPSLPRQQRPLRLLLPWRLWRPWCLCPLLTLLLPWVALALPWLLLLALLLLLLLWEQLLLLGLSPGLHQGCTGRQEGRSAVCSTTSIVVAGQR